MTRVELQGRRWKFTKQLSLNGVAGGHRVNPMAATSARSFNPTTLTRSHNYEACTGG
jgi:hypothetical protein